MVAAVTTPGIQLLRNVSLQDGVSVMQSFCRDDQIDGDWYIQQVQGTEFGKTHTQHLADGDLVLNRVDQTGTLQDVMYLNGFGHGESMDIQPKPGGGYYIWGAADSQLGPDGSLDGYGKKVCRFTYSAGATITVADVDDLFDPNPGQYRNGVSLDLDNGYVMTRYENSSFEYWVQVYDYDEFMAGTFNPIRTFQRPTLPSTSQSWCMYPGGRICTWLSGTATAGDTYITFFDENQILYEIFVDDLPSMVWREPEGVQIIDGMVMNGFASGGSGARQANIFAHSIPSIVQLHPTINYVAWSG